MDVREPSTQSWRVKSLHVDEQCEEGTDYGGEQQNREVANWRVREGFPAIVKSIDVVECACG